MNNLIEGVEYIRRLPTKNGDYSNTTEPIVFDGFTSDGEIIMHYTERSWEGRHFGTQSLVLPKGFTDENWIRKNAIKRYAKTSLDQFRGKMIKRIKPVVCEGCRFITKSKLSKRCIPEIETTTVYIRSYMTEPVMLVAATRYHVIIIDSCGDEKILDVRFTNPDDWALA